MHFIFVNSIQVLAKAILILTNRVPYPLNDGGNLAMHAMIEGYHKAGWEVHLLSMNTSRHYITQEKIKTIYTYLSSFKAVDVNNDVSILGTLKNFFFSKKPNHAERFFNTNFLKTVESTIEKYAPSVIQIESIYLSTYLPYLYQVCNSKLILRMHNIEYQVWERLANETRNPLKRVYLKDLAKRIKLFEINAWNAYDLLLPITKDDARVLKDNSIKTNMLVTPFGLDISNSGTNIPKERWVGYHLGAMDWLPNVEAMKWFRDDVWSKVHEILPDFKFYFAGRNMPKGLLTNNPDGIICEGEVADANKFIADKKILIVPLRAGGGIRVKILEAMVADKIVISTDIGMQGIDAVPFIHYMPANSPSDFANAILWCCEHKHEAQNMADAASRFVSETYDNTIIIHRLLVRIDEIDNNGNK